MKRILLAYDGTPAADTALTTTVALAKAFEAEVGVVSVVPVHPGRAPVGLHTRKGRPQRRQRVHLIHQAEPTPSFDARFERRQHPLRPHHRFSPGPPRADLSNLCSRCRHWRWVRILWSVRHDSTSLGPFAPRPLQALPRSYGPSDSCTGGSSSRERMNTLLIPMQVSLFHVHSLADRSVASHRGRPCRRFCTLPLTAPGARVRVRLRLCPADSPTYRPKRVRHPTDQSSTSGCSPPRLTAAQLPLVSGRRAHAWRGLAPP